jgi:hypothetical protein
MRAANRSTADGANEAEAAIVRRIFTAFAARKSPRAIAHGLNADHVPGPGGRPWSDTTIRGHAEAWLAGQAAQKLIPRVVQAKPWLSGSTNWLPDSD